MDERPLVVRQRNPVGKRPFQTAHDASLCRCEIKELDGGARIGTPGSRDEEDPLFLLGSARAADSVAGTGNRGSVSF